MPPRRSHAKSRQGCRNCKLRRVKCDEKHPQCGNCLKHGIECNFSIVPHAPVQPGEKRVIPRLQTRPTQTEAEVGQSSISASIQRRIAAPNGPQNVALAAAAASMNPSPLNTAPSWRNNEQLVELRLLDHYMDTTMTRRYAMPIAQEIWTQIVPRLAFSNTCLLDALLGVTAQHIRVADPGNGMAIEASHKYIARAIRAFSQRLQAGGVDSNNAEALYVTSLVIAFHTFVGRRFRLAAEDEDVSLAVYWFQPFQGVRAVVEAGSPWIFQSRMAPLWPGLSADRIVPTDQEGRPILPYAFLLEDLHDRISLEDIREAYEYPVLYLSMLHRDPDRRRLLRFLAETPKRFVELVAAHEPLALIVAGCFFYLMKISEEVWWLQGSCDREIDDIFTTLPEWWKPRLERGREIAEARGEELQQAGFIPNKFTFEAPPQRFAKVAAAARFAHYMPHPPLQVPEPEFIFPEPKYMDNVRTSMENFVA